MSRGGGAPLHSAKIFSLRPRIRDSSGVFPAVSNPAWFDPSYWYEGMRLTSGWKDQLSTASRNLRYYARKFPIAISIMTFGLKWIQVRRKAAPNPAPETPGDGTAPLWIAAMIGFLLPMRLPPPFQSSAGLTFAFLLFSSIFALATIATQGVEQKGGAAAIAASAPLSD